MKARKLDKLARVITFMAMLGLLCAPITLSADILPGVGSHAVAYADDGDMTTQLGQAEAEDEVSAMYFGWLVRVAKWVARQIMRPIYWIMNNCDLWILVLHQGRLL